MTNTLKIITLGHLNILKDGQPVLQDTSRRKAEALFVYLACNPREHSREVLATLFWSESEQSRAMANLRVTLHTVKKYLSDYLDITRQTVAFRADAPCWLDIQYLLDTLQRARKEEQQTGDISDETIGLLEDALTLYRGEFLEGFYLRDNEEFEIWQQNQQRYIHQQVVNGLLRLANAFNRRQNYEKALDTLQTLFDLEPLHEQAHYEYLRLLLSQGNTHKAKQVYQRYTEQLQAQLGEQPPPAFAALFSDHGHDHPKPEPPHRLPQYLTAFVKRPKYIQQIAQRLNTPDCRLLTLVGAGGMGKTRLAVHMGEQMLHHFPDGVYFLPLSAITKVALIPFALADMLEIPSHEQQPIIDLLFEALQNKRMLLILDNFEHILDGADFVAELLQHTTRLKVLATSHEPLNLMGEWLIPVYGMEANQNSTYNEAIALFDQTAKRVKPDFDIDDHKALVIEICQMLDGLPLAIELAAARLWHESIEAVHRQLERDAVQLSTSARNLPPRHKSVQATIDHSWQMLSREAQSALAKLSVFNGDFSTEAAEAITGVGRAALQQFAHRSWLRPLDNERYSLHRLLYLYLREQLPAFADGEALYELHHHYYRDHISHILTNIDNEIDQLNALDEEIEQIRSAMAWALEQERPTEILEIANQLAFYWERRGNFAEGRYWFENALALPQPVPVDIKANAYYYAGMCAWGQSDYEAGRRFAQENLALSKAAEDPMLLMRALLQNGLIEIHASHYDKAKTYLGEALQIARQIGDERRVAIAAANLGAICIETEDYAAAINYYETGLDYWQQGGSEHHLATALANLGHSYMHVDDDEAARATLQEAVTIFEKLQSPWGISLARNFLGCLALKQGDCEAAYEQHYIAFEQACAIGNRARIARQTYEIGQVFMARQQLETAIKLFFATEAMLNILSEKQTEIDNELNSAIQKISAYFNAQQINGLQAQVNDWDFEQVIDFVHSLKR